jgi:hypothetical protein
MKRSWRLKARPSPTPKPTPKPTLKLIWKVKAKRKAKATVAALVAVLMLVRVMNPRNRKNRNVRRKAQTLTPNNQRRGFIRHTVIVRYV